MELFIPSLIVLILSAIVCFVILPKMTPYTLGAVSLILFFLGIWQNYRMFPNEYKGIVSAASSYSPFILLSVVILGAMGFILRYYGKTPPPLTNALPVAPAAVVNAVNTALEPFNLSGNSNGKNNGKNGKNQNTRANGQNLASTSFKVV